MEPLRANREAWDIASRKYVVEGECLDEERLADVEVSLLAPILETAPRVIHLQSGNCVDAIEPLATGARSAVGVDFSAVAVGAAVDRARRLGSSAQYVVGAVPATPLAAGCADLVYTGKGALMWLSDLRAWAREVARCSLRAGRSSSTTRIRRRRSGAATSTTSGSTRGAATSVARGRTTPFRRRRSPASAVMASRRSSGSGRSPTS